MKSLPDYLTPGLKLLFVGINPSLHSSRAGHYYANPRYRFWGVFNSAELIPIRLNSEDDFRVLEFGVGFTDIVKRPTPGVKDLANSEFIDGAVNLRQKLLFYQPTLVCFQGVMVYERYLRFGEGIRRKVGLGLQQEKIGASFCFVVPNPSPANAGFSFHTLVGWYLELKAFLEDKEISEI